MHGSEPRKILVIRLSSIGDILLTSPLLRLLSLRFPQAQIDFCSKEKYAELLQPHPTLRQVLVLEPRGGWQALRRLKQRIRSENYDLIIDVHKNFRSLVLADGRAQITRYRKYYFKRWLLVHLGWNLLQDVPPVYRRYLESVQPWHLEDDGRYPEFFLTPAEKELARSAVQRLGSPGAERRIGLAVGAGYETKQWPVEHFVRLAGLLREKLAVRVFIFGAATDQAFAQPIAEAAGSAGVNLCGQLTLRQTAAWVAEMEVMVTNDSGLMHLATAVKTPTVALFGSTTRELGFFPAPPFVRVLERPDLSCRPCSHVGRHRCPKGHFRCMKEITADMVLHQIDELLNGAMAVKQP